MLSSRLAQLPDIDGATAKTPGRMTLKGRSALQENALHQGSKPTVVTTHVSSRVLLDKTPFANRAGAPLNTPLPRGSKLTKMPLSISQSVFQTPGTLLRPSSTRKHIRVPRSASKSFETPQSQGNHWDVSDISIEGPETATVNESIGEEDTDEVEYMPPSAIEPSYEPLFEMPDYKKIGCIIKNLNHSYYFDDESYETGIEDNVLLEAGSYELSLPALNDDNPLRPILGSSRIISTQSKQRVTTGSGVSQKRAEPPFTAAHSTRPFPATRPVSRTPTVAGSRVTSVAGMRTASSSRAGIGSSAPARRPTRTPPDVVAGGGIAPVHKGPTITARNKDATRTSVRTLILPNTTQATTSALPPRHPVASTPVHKSGAAISTAVRSDRIKVRNTSAGQRRTSGATRPVDHDDLVLKFDTAILMAAENGGDDFMFDV